MEQVSDRPYVPNRRNFAAATPSPTARVNDPVTFTIETDRDRNRTRLSYQGTVTAEHLVARFGEFEGFLEQMRPEFTVMVDFSGLDTMALDCVPYLTRIMDLCKARGLGTVIRVIPDPAKDIGLNILSLIHYRGEVRIITCTTLAEAEQLYHGNHG